MARGLCLRALAPLVVVISLPLIGGVIGAVRHLVRPLETQTVAAGVHDGLGSSRGRRHSLQRMMVLSCLEWLPASL